MKRRAFTAVELVIVIGVLAALLAILLPVARRTRLASGLEASLSNVRTIMAATSAYMIDTGLPPMRGSRYSSGTMSGWDTWCLGGKNSSTYWNTAIGGLFTESAYSRPLNAYLDGSRIPRPPGYVNAGSGANWPGHPGTWTLQTGTPTAAQQALQIPVFKSPGDVATRQRNWPNVTPGVTCYDDVGTSYLVNMKWWDQPGIPTNFTQRYTQGCERIALPTISPRYVLVHDQTGDMVANGIATVGEFGKQNASVCGFIDGRAAYMEMVPGGFSGPGYTLVP
ncbi:MAG: hypothetical protein JNM80_02945 [Phycisphaerae bacterium]|nr:hypothetical protein [Phycisphaerae bacterium]